MIIISLGHRARQGKDTAAAAIVKAKGHLFDIKCYSFAAAMKDELSQLDQLAECTKLGVAYDCTRPMTDPLCQSFDGKQSALLQYWGQARRNVKPNYWVDKVALQIKIEKPQVALITDVRHRNEFQWVKSMGGTTVKVTRLGFVDLTRDPNHISEIELDGVVFDYDINCREGELEQLKDDAVTVFDLVAAQLQPNQADLSELARIAGHT